MWQLFILKPYCIVAFAGAWPETTYFFLSRLASYEKRFVSQNFSTPCPATFFDFQKTIQRAVPNELAYACGPRAASLIPVAEPKYIVSNGRHMYKQQAMGGKVHSFPILTPCQEPLRKGMENCAWNNLSAGRCRMMLTEHVA